MATKGTVLVVDDEPSIRRYLQTLLEVEGYSVLAASGGREALDIVQGEHRPDLVILDVLMPEMDGLETLQNMMRVDPGLRVVMLSCSGEVATVVEAIKLGAQDYLTKPFEKSELDAALLKCQKRTELEREKERLEEYCERVTEDLSFIASSPQMLRIREQVLQIAPVDVPVFLYGESGVGKEVIARMIHLRSPRASQPFIKVNCAALPSELLESELFGYEPGAFTGATRSKPGKFELANHGTIFLDEIAEMTTHLQAKLLHVLQDQQYSRLGGRSLVSVDVRVIAATNADVHEAIRTGRFREDLYYRLNVFTVHVPPLRERTKEIPILLTHFVNKYSEKLQKPAPPIPGELIEATMSYSWPGNLRELENFAKRYVILENSDAMISELTLLRARDDTSEAVSDDGGSPHPAQGLKSLVRSLKDQAEMQAIAQALDKTNWNRKEAARLLNISYKALLYKIRQFNLDPGRAQRSRGPRQGVEKLIP
jgi:two-component system response regulator AtoC